MSPLCLDPEARFPVVLESDRKKGTTPAPTFWFRYLTFRQWQRTGEFLEALTAANYHVDAAMGQRLYDLLRVNLAGWDNLPVAYRPEDLEDVTCLDEALELLYAARRQTKPDEAALGNSSSPSPTNGAASAEGAPAAPPAAAISPAN